MKLTEFIMLDASEKKSALLHYGVLIAKRKNDYSMLFLFQMTQYYVEASFNIDNKNVEGFRVGNHDAILNPYLEKISVAGLIH